MADQVGLVITVPTTIKPLGTGVNAGGTTASNSKPVTEGVQTIVATNEKSKSFWDFLGDAAEKANVTGLINQYVGGKIVKEQINDGVPVYTTTGNPSDQPGGKLLSDVSVEQQNSRTKTLLFGAGVVGVIIIGIILARRS